MHPFPHRYRVSSTASSSGTVELRSAGLPSIASAPPIEFDGPGDAWSPETLLVAAVADCFVLSFRAVAAASRLAWTTVECDVDGVLDRVEKATQFIELHIHARLYTPVEVAAERAERVLQKAEQACLISNSLKATVHLTTTITSAAS